MLSTKNLILGICFLLCLAPFSMAQEVKYGLEFRSHEVDKESRTGLDLTPDEPFNFPNGFSISFDALFKRKNQQIFGCIIKIIGENNHIVNLVLASEFGAYPNVVATSSIAKFPLNYKFVDYGNRYDEWLHFIITFETGKNLLHISIGNMNYSFDIPNADDFKNVNIAFGKNDYLKTPIRDVPPMVIKEIMIKNLKEKPIYHWTLSKHVANGTYDELKKHLASCSNPLWIIDKHASWTKLSTLNVNRNPQICYNERRNEIAIVDAFAFNTYNMNTGILRRDSMITGQPHGSRINQLIYDPFNNQYCSYSFERKTSHYDPLEKTWNNNTPDYEQYYWHHNRYMYPGDSCLYVFFGYGYHKYKDEIIRYDFKKDSFETVVFGGDSIYPRYLSGLGKVDDDRVLVFGGYGCATGNQEIFPQNYYDCYIIHLKNKEIKKLWEINNPDKNFVVANSLVVDTINRCFYTLCFPQQEFNTYLQLYRFSMDIPEYKLLADSIPFIFHDTDSYVDLFLNKASQELFAVAFSSGINPSSSVSIYKLAYPPLSKTDLFQNNAKKQSEKGLILAGIIVLSCLLGAYMQFIIRKKKNKKENNSIKSIVDPEEYEPVVGIKPVNIRTKKQSVFLFGGFQVIDREGRDVSGEFTPLLKQLFLIILLHTLKDGKGISSLRLRETLWFDKSEESAKNNRGVLLSRLRQIFDQIGDFHIKNQDSHWFIEFGEDIYCDYYEALILMKRLKDKNNRTEKDIKRFFSIISFGDLLPNLQIDWVDPFKANFLNELIDLFLDIVKQPGLNISSREFIDITNAVLIHDSLNEEALRLKCSTLVDMGKNRLAQKTYNSFIKEYHLLFGKEFEYSFDHIISHFL